MTKEEYKTIIELLDKGRTDELRIYLSQRMDLKYINMVLKTIKEIIESDCKKEYPSYYQRKELHQGVLKLYKGFYTENNDGFIICHKRSNIFELYDRSILTPNIIRGLEGSYYFGSDEIRETNRSKINALLSQCSKDNISPIFSTSNEENGTMAWDAYGHELIVPSQYYKIAHNLLGDDLSEYIYKDYVGIYFDSPRGRALVASKKE